MQASDQHSHHTFSGVGALMDPGFLRHVVNEGHASTRTCVAQGSLAIRLAGWWLGAARGAASWTDRAASGSQRTAARFSRELPGQCAAAARRLSAISRR
jgi:hypothetical protein